HWTSARSGAMTVHYLVRAVALVIAAVGVVVVCGRYEVRGDITEKKLASLAPQTKQLLADLETDRVVKIDAFVSPEVPEDYVQTRLNLLNTLREIQALAGDKIQVRVTETEQFTEEATLAEQRYKITPRQVTTLDQDKVNIDQIFLGVAIRCGLNRVVIPFLDRGIPIEYELIRSIGTVVQQKRKRLGILTTGAPLYGQFNMQTMSAGRNWPIVDELEKQYEVIQIDPAKPIDVKECDVLLAVQPSMLGPQQMDHFVDAVRAGLPTVIFEDPAPVASGGVTATSQQRRPPGGMMMMQQQPPPKGDIQKLWNLLGVEFSGDSVVWQNYNPYPKMADVFWPEFVFVASKNNVDEELGMEGFNEDDPISSGLQELLLLFPGSITELNVSSLKMEPLAETGTQSGSIPYNEIFQMSPFGGPGGLNPRRQHVLMNRSYVMAARIRGEVDAPVEDDAPAENPDAEEKSAKKPAKKSTIDVVLVADVDVISPEIFRLREQPELPGLRIELNFDNVTFVLNALDELAGNTEYIEIRKRRPVHRTLTRIDEETKDARKETAEVSEKANRDFDQAQKDEEKKLRERLMKLEKDYQSKHLDQQEILQKVQIALVEGQKRMNARMEKLEQERDRKIHEINTKLVIKTRQVQERYKLFAVLLPPIPPLLLAGIVFMLRRLREKEGVAQKRLRS
ncbi:MAG: Gldg family protein, partial [Pirellulales bacterium]|nr:Gldg family protein [Pirellulales bacterium]